jgi:hypothetical protein
LRYTCSVKRLALCSVIALALLWLLREAEYAGVRRGGTGEFAKLRETFLGRDSAQLLILGSSRAACQFVPGVFERECGMRVWNAGMTGATVPLFRTTLEAWLETHPAPEAVIINLDIHALDDAFDSVFDYPRYLPFLQNEALYNGLCRQDKRFAAYRFVAPYALAQGNTRLLNAGLRGWLSGKPAPAQKGYEESVKRGYTGSMYALLTTGKAAMPSTTYREELRLLAAVCHARKIKPVFVISPLWIERQNRITNYNQLIAEFTMLARENKCAFFDFSNAGLACREEFYTDPAHLNRNGAEQFSALAAMKIAAYLHKN